MTYTGQLEVMTNDNAKQSVKQLLHYRNSVLNYKWLNELAPEYLSKKYTCKRFNIYIRDTRTCEACVDLYITTGGLHV